MYLVTTNIFEATLQFFSCVNMVDSGSVLQHFSSTFLPSKARFPSYVISINPNDKLLMYCAKHWFSDQLLWLHFLAITIILLQQSSQVICLHLNTITEKFCSLNSITTESSNFFETLYYKTCYALLRCSSTLWFGRLFDSKFKFCVKE